MNTTEAHAVHEHSTETFLSGLAGSSIAEGIGALSAMILAIIGLAGIFADDMAAIATIVVGAVILMEGGLAGLACRWLPFQGAERQTLELGGGVTAEFLWRPRRDCLGHPGTVPTNA